MVTSWEGEGRELGKGAGIKNKLVGVEWLWGVKYSIGNGVADECICMTHGRELRWGLLEGMGVTGWRRAKGEKLGQL